ncbi:MAG TPA: type II toxin-antitoxin system RelE/ParE family toxin [Chthoniobacterales bacterium]|nr:type II toxin-antitoxin system RelE/ParE family toxin [Chthoniobacterales bacterium]
MDYQITIAPRARRDLREGIRYISLDSPQAAERFAILLSSKIKILKRHPEIGRVVPEVDDIAIREIIVGNYRVMYEIDSLEKQVEILRYWHAARGTPDFN